MYRAKHDRWSECEAPCGTRMRKTKVALALRMTTGELTEIERLTVSSGRGGWKSAHRGNSLAAYSTARTVLPTSGGSDPFAEFNRALRPAVIARKVSQCSKNARGAQAFAVFTSVVRTLARTGTDSIVEGLLHVFHSAQMPDASAEACHQSR